MPRKKARQRRHKGDGTVFYSESKGCWLGRAIVGRKPDGRPLYRECRAPTQELALQRLKAAEQAPASASPTKTTLSQYLDHWLENVAKPSVRLTTWAAYEVCVRVHLKPGIGHYQLDQLRPADVEAYLAKLRLAGVSGGNARKIADVLSMAMTQAAKAGLLTSSPTASLRKPRSDAADITPFTKDEAGRILAAAAGHRLEALFVLALATGARQGELLGLGWEHVNGSTIRIERTLTHVKGRWVMGEPKSKRGRRTIDLPPFAVAALERHRERMKAEKRDMTGLVFPSRRGKYIMKTSLIRLVYRPLLARADVPYRKFHTFRHTHASELLALRHSAVDVAARLGDRPEVILRTYAHVLRQGNTAMADATERLYAATLSPPYEGKKRGKAGQE